MTTSEAGNVVGLGDMGEDESEFSDGLPISFAPSFLKKVEKLPDQMQKKISTDLASCYGKSCKNLFLMQIQGYWSDAQSHMLNLVASDRFCISVEKFTIKVEATIDEAKGLIVWHVCDLLEYDFENVVRL